MLRNSKICNIEIADNKIIVIPGRCQYSNCAESMDAERNPAFVMTTHGPDRAGGEL
jgi:hypothetical protein